VYRHTQRAPLHLFLAAIALVLFYAGWRSAEEAPTWVWLMLFAMGFAFLFLAVSFTYLTVEDEGEFLAVRFGPLPFFGRRVPYTDITAVRRCRSSLIDGWGIHYTPRRGWIYNLWGFDCVELTLKDGTFRIGSDDANGLETFLRKRCSV
jgi:hypothetical protein